MTIPQQTSYSREEKRPLPENSEGPQLLQAPSFRELDWLWHGFSTRTGGVSTAYGHAETAGKDGELNLGFTAEDSTDVVQENRKRLAHAVTGSRDTPLIAVRQVHSNRYEWVRHESTGWTGEAAPQADGLLTQVPGLLLAIQTADCIPVLVVDRANRAVAGFHAGWRGTVQRIVELGVRSLQAEAGSKPENLVAAIGPGIGACCYEVGAEVQDRFGESFDYGAELFRQGDKPGLNLDLREANRRQLLAAGLAPQAISLVGGCTSCHPEMYFSHRASGGRTGRMMAVLGIRTP